MTKKEIIKKLKDNWIKQGSWKEYDRAKKVICSDQENINKFEYEFRIRVLTEYMNL
jgi:hypothetical protein